MQQKPLSRCTRTAVDAARQKEGSRIFADFFSSLQATDTGHAGRKKKRVSKESWETEEYLEEYKQFVE